MKHSSSILLSLFITYLSQPSIAFGENQALSHLAAQITADQEGHLFEHNELPLASLPSDLKTRLLAFAIEQTQVWPDKILEGDYVLHDEALTLDEVVAFTTSQKQVVAYKITFSQGAWATGSCSSHLNAFEITGSNKSELLQNCVPGRIVGSAFVSHDLLHSIPNDGEPVEFQD